MKIAASVLNIPFFELDSQLKELEEGGVDYLHIDVMDGNYVPNLAFPVNCLKEIHEHYPAFTIEAHLMVTNPMDYVEGLKDAGVTYVSFHTDSTRFVRRMIDRIHAAGMKAGVVINPSQRTDHIVPYIEYLDLVTLMGVEPGYGGQPLLPGTMKRLKELAELRKEYNAHFLLSEDAGLTEDLFDECMKMGVDYIPGSKHTIFNQEDSIKTCCIRINNKIVGGH